MDKLLGLIGKILPLIPFYPRWAQYLFGITFTLFVLSVLVGGFWYFSASEKRPRDVPQEVPGSDVGALSVPLIDLQIRRINASADDLYLINKGKEAAKRIVIICSPKEVWGWGQKVVSVIAPKDEIKVFRIHHSKDFQPHCKVSVRVQFADVFDELYLCKYEGPYRHVTLIDCHKAKDKQKPVKKAKEQP